MITHVKVIAVLLIAFGALFLLGAFVVMLIFGAGAASVGLSGEPDAQLVNQSNIPFGTILGAYGLWVLLNNETERLFNSTNLAPL